MHTPPRASLCIILGLLMIGLGNARLYYVFSSLSFFNWDITMAVLQTHQLTVLLQEKVEPIQCTGRDVLAIASIHCEFMRGFL
ncbi:hypothetical protein CW304_24650 [Bacillus sp. UFRGS-B20]|nr:hypothetical protein CW304_24650 [Bacillus sp. UFRGS-B20]